MQAPKIDTRNFDELLKVLEEKAAEALPDWKPGPGDFGLALIKIFAYMAEEVVDRLNRVPHKHFAAFLDMLGITLLPAAAAKAPITFTLAEGTDQHVPIPRGTQVAAGEKDVVFETEQSILATPAKLVKVITADALYLGFDQKIQKGPVSIYFSLEGQEGLKQNQPRVWWYYVSGPGEDEWKILEALDHTANMTESGTVEFFFPADFAKVTQFNEELYWIKAVGIAPEMEWFLKQESIHLNTCMAAQLESIEDEILGSSDGSASQEYRLQRAPVICQEIWIDETRTITAEGKRALIHEMGEDTIREIIDESSDTTTVEVRWQAKEDFFASSSRSRHYVIEAASGRVRFGDGIHGMIPAIGSNNIKASYRVGGGKAGNVGAFEISELRTSIPYVDSVANPEPAYGGSETEQMPGLFNRGPYLLKHRARAVTLEDFERIASEVSGEIARIKCVLKCNRLTIIVIPYGSEEKPMPSSFLRKLVKQRVLEKSVNTLPSDHIVVQKPQYLEVSLTVDIFPESIDEAALLESRLLKRIKAFLHPLYGGPEKRGWDFGRDLHISDVYALLESCRGVEHAAGLLLNGKEQDVTVNEFQTLCSGQHTIKCLYL